MTVLVHRLLVLGDLPRRRIALSVTLGALAVGFGVALMTTAGYLISRAAEQPPILSLTTTIVVVRFFALARPLARYLERLASHDLALRALGRIPTPMRRRRGEPGFLPVSWDEALADLGARLRRCDPDRFATFVTARLRLSCVRAGRAKKSGRTA